MRLLRRLVVPIVLVAGLLPAPASAQRGRFPVFVYTTPDSIREAQDGLVALKYLAPDGFKAGTWDKPTKAAAREFQRDHFLRPDGLLDRDTMALLESHVPRRGGTRR